jgi:hypothetical protein
MNNKSLTALPGDPTDELCHSIFKQHGGEFVGDGTYLGGDRPERDVEYDVPRALVASCKAALRRGGCRVEEVSMDRDYENWEMKR